MGFDRRTDHPMAPNPRKSLKIEFSCEEEKTLVLQFCRLDDIDRELPFLFFLVGFLDGH